MANLGPLLLLLIEVVLLVLKHRYDPERLKRELTRRIDDESEKRRQTFRRAVAERDEDAVSRLLARVRDRLRSRRGVSPRRAVHLTKGEPAPHDGWLLSDDDLAELYDLLEQKLTEEDLPGK